MVRFKCLLNQFMTVIQLFQYYTEVTALQCLIKRNNKISFIFSAFSDTFCI
jgi:hypothetical protein